VRRVNELIISSSSCSHRFHYSSLRGNVGWSAFRSLTLVSRQRLEGSQRRWRRDHHRLHQQSDPR
jgi:hypothetical protein